MDKNVTKQVGRVVGKIFWEGTKITAVTAVGVYLATRIFGGKEVTKSMKLEDWVDRL